MTIYIGSIVAFGFNFPSVGWQLCDGSLLPISNYQPLFTLIGTTYGGDGINTFAVPDLRGRVPIGTGQGPGLSNYVLGQKAGSETVTLTSANLPAHNHGATVTGGNGPANAFNATLNGVTGVNSGTSPQNSLLAASRSPTSALYAAAGSATVAMAPNSITLQGADVPTPNVAIGMSGGSNPFPIMQPYQVVNYCIATEGIWPQHP